MSVVEVFYREFGHFNVDIKDWSLNESGITALWGPSGSGKSTIVKGLLGLDPQCKVIWNFSGENIALKSPGERKLGVVFQDLALFPHLSAQDNILFPVNKNKHPHWQEDFQLLVEQLDMERRLSWPIHRLSGGEQQRVALARALINRPQMLLLDEPFSSLDESLRGSARDMIKKLNQKFSCPMLLITHDRQDVRALADKVSYIEMGKITKESTSAEF